MTSYFNASDPQHMQGPVHAGGEKAPRLGKATKLPPPVVGKSIKVAARSPINPMVSPDPSLPPNQARVAGPARKARA